MKVLGAGLLRLFDTRHCCVDIDIDNIIYHPNGAIEVDVDIFPRLVAGKIRPVAAGLFELFGGWLPDGVLVLRGPEGRKGGPEGIY